MVAASSRPIVLTVVGIALFVVGLLWDVGEGVATALIAIGSGQVTVGVLLPQLSELEIGPGGFKLKLKARDEELAPVVEREGAGLAKLAAFLAASADGAQRAAEEALARTYAQLPPPLDPPAEAKRHLVEAVASGADGPRSAEPEPPQGAEWRPLSRALAALPAESRAALVLSVYEGMSERRIAELLGIPAKAVGEKLHAAERDLAARLGSAA